jgi:hypothetical protein
VTVKIVIRCLSREKQTLLEDVSASAQGFFCSRKDKYPYILSRGFGLNCFG